MASRERQVRTAAAGERLLHDVDQEVALGSAAKVLQVRGMRRLAERAQHLVQPRRDAHVLHQAGTRSTACSVGWAAEAGTVGHAYLGAKHETVPAEGCRSRRRQAARQGSRGAGQPRDHF
jgi:hypothetical protein